MPSTTELFQEGVAAAKAGQRERARDLLTRVTELDPNNAPAWLWLSGVTTTLADRIPCLEHAAALEPENTRIVQALGATWQQMIAQWMHESAAAIEAGAPERARELLMRVVERDEADVDAWWRLSQVVESPDDRELCLENVLTLDPGHTEAREMLAYAQREGVTADVPPEESLGIPTLTPPEAIVSPPPPLIAPVDDAISRPSLPEAPHDLLLDALACPYCASATIFEDRRCPACAHELWMRRRETEQRSTSYWILVALEGAFVLAGFLLPLLLLTYVTMRMGIDDVMSLVPIYLGRADLPAPETAVLFDLVPRELFWLSLIPSGLSLLILFSALTRWPPAFFVAATLGGVRMVIGIGSLALALSSHLDTTPLDVTGTLIVRSLNTFSKMLRTSIFASDVMVVAFSAIALTLLLNLHDHFSFEAHRLLLRIDADVDGSDVGLWLRGREYAQQGMWARAALHLRYALGIERRTEAFLALAVVYSHLGWFNLADSILEDAQQFSPGDPQIQDFIRLLAQKRGDVESDHDTI
jgi:tetratricopeptide (TPR) repeat protein